jgi:hypothetical protein
MRFGSGLRFLEAEKKKEYFQLLKCNVHFRQTDHAYVYHKDDDDKWVLAGYGHAPFVVHMEVGEFKIESKGKVYMASEVADQTAYITSDEKYTSLDRPPAMSPEMAAITRMVKANELRRERDLRELEARYERRTQQDGPNTEVVEEFPEVEGTPGTEELVGGDEHVEGQQDESSSQETSVSDDRPKKAKGPK